MEEYMEQLAIIVNLELGVARRVGKSTCGGDASTKAYAWYYVRHAIARAKIRKMIVCIGTRSQIGEFGLRKGTALC